MAENYYLAKMFCLSFRRTCLNVSMHLEMPQAFKHRKI